MHEPCSTKTYTFSHLHVSPEYSTMELSGPVCEGLQEPTGVSRNAADTHKNNCDRSRENSYQTLETELSRFGQLYRLLDGLVTSKTLEWVHGNQPDACGAEPFLACQALQEGLQKKLEESYVWLIDSIDLGEFQDDVHHKFLDFCTTARSLKSLARLDNHGWHLIGYAIFEAMSWYQKTELAGILLASDIIEDLLDSQGMTRELYQALLGVFAENRLL